MLNFIVRKVVFYRIEFFDVICSGSKKKPAVFSVVYGRGVFYRIRRHGHDLRGFYGFNENAISVRFMKGEFKGVAAIANSSQFEVWSMDVGDAGREYFIFGARDNLHACARFRGIPDHPNIRVEVRKSTEPCNSKPDCPGTIFPKAVAGRVDDFRKNRITNGLPKKESQSTLKHDRYNLKRSCFK